MILQHEPELLGEMKLELEERKETGMRLALVQMPNYGSKDENLHKSLQAIEIASKQGAVPNRGCLFPDMLPSR